MSLFLVFGLFFVNQYGFSQCTKNSNVACTTAAPTAINSFITCNPPTTNNGKQNFEVTGMIAGNTYRVDNCNSTNDTELTIYDSTLANVAFNAGLGSACTSVQPSIDFIPAANGTYYMQLNKDGCANSSSLNGTIKVTLLTLACTKPTTQATATAFTNNTTGTSLTANWTRGNGTGGVIVVARLTSVLAVAPISGTAYTANAAFGSGNITGTDNFVVYRGTGNFVNVTSLTNSSDYTFTIYEYNINTNCYIATGASSSVTAGYCASTGSSSSYYINNFSTTLGTTNITNNSSGYATGGYLNATAKVVTQYANTSVNFSATFTGGTDTYGFAIFVDWNNDSDFADTGETVFTTTGYVTSQTGSFSVPIGQAIGSYRMRIVANYISTGPASCNTTAIFGETEDYTFTVVALAPPAITSFTPTSGCVGSSITITGTNFTGATAVTIGNTAVSSITSITATQIIAVVGSGTIGTVKVTTPGGIGTSSSTFTVNASPIVNPITGASSVCAGNSITLADTTSGGVWSVTNGTGTASITSLGVLTGTTAGTVTVVYTVTASGCSTPVSFLVTISAGPIITTQPISVAIAAGANTSFSIVAAGSTSYSWQVSTDGGSTWSIPITNSAPYSTATTNSLTITGATAMMNGYLYKATATNTCGSTISSGGTLTISQFTLVPSSGSNTITCGTNTTLYDHAGPSSDYSNNANGYTVIENSGTGVISLSGDYNTESGFDYIYIYSGVGTSGTLLNSYSGRNGTITPFSTAPGQSITVQFFSDGSKQRAGFALNVAYSGACEVCGSLPTTLISSAITATSATISWTAAASPPSGGYQWEVRTLGAAGSGATGLSATGTTAAGVVTANVTGLTQNTTYYFYVRSLCAGTNFSAWTNSSSFTTPIAAPINNNCSAATPLSVSPNLTCTTSTSGTTVNATQSLSGCSGTADDDVWYSFVATGSSHIVTVTPSTSNGINNIVFEVFTGSCSSTTSLGCIDATGTSNPETATLTGLTSGSTYYVRVYSRGSNSNNQGAFSICVTSFPACTTPTTQPTGLVFSGITSTSINGSFTAPASAPSNYLVIMNTTGTAPVPVNGTTYTVGSTSLGATNVVISTTNSTTFSSTGLNPNQQYYFYVFSYNATGCSGGPLYLSSPLIGNAFTLTSTSYCTASVSSNNYASNGTYFTNVSFLGTLHDTSNTSTFNSSTPLGYEDWTVLTDKAIQAQGEGVNVSVQALISGYMKAWVDWNKDGDFTDLGELVYDTGSLSQAASTFGFIIPTNQTIGDYRIRIRINDYSGISTFTSCGTINNYGETEDYLFTVTASCSATIASVIDDATCGPGATTLKATAASGVFGFRWYAALSGGTYLAQTITGNWTTPSIPATTTYYVTAYNSTCESLVRTPVIATYNPIPTVVFSPPSPLLCGENTLALSATGGSEEVFLVKENFEGGMGVFSNVNYVNNGPTINGYAAWQSRTSTYRPSAPNMLWLPAISSGVGANKFVSSTSELGNYRIYTGLSLTNSVNSTGFTNLKLTFDSYYSHYLDGQFLTTDYFTVEVSTNNGTSWAEIQRYTADIGIGTRFGNITLDLISYINIPNLKIRFRYYGEYFDGVAIDNVKLFGSKPMSPSFSWSSTPPVNVYSNALCTIPYTSGTPVSTVYIKPTIEQLSSNTFNLIATATLSNGCSVSQNITALVTPKTTPTFAQVAPICAGTTLAALPTTSTNGVTGTWSPALNNTVTTTYIFTPNSTNVGCFSSEDMTIEVNPKITPSFTQVAAVCSGASLSPLPTSSSDTIPITGAWSPAINNTVTTTYTFTPTAGQCANTAPMTITVLPALNAGAHSITVLNGCSNINPSELIFTTAPSGGNLPYSYQWQNNTIDIPSAITNSYDPPSLTIAGTYSYRCKITDACGNVVYTSPKIVNVALDPNAPSATMSPTTTSVCVGTTLTLLNPLYGTQPGQSCGFEYITSIDNGLTWSSIVTTRPSFSATGSNNRIKIRVANSCSSGCNASPYTEYIWTVTPLTTITLQPSIANQSVCSSASATALSVTATGSGLTYQWYSNSSTVPISGATNATFSPPTNIAGSFTYYCIVSGTCGAITSDFSGIITINPTPITTPIYHE